MPRATTRCPKPTELAAVANAPNADDGTSGRPTACPRCRTHTSYSRSSGDDQCCARCDPACDVHLRVASLANGRRPPPPAAEPLSFPHAHMYPHPRSSPPEIRAIPMAWSSCWPFCPLLWGVLRYHDWQLGNIVRCAIPLSSTYPPMAIHPLQVAPLVLLYYHPPFVPSSRTLPCFLPSSPRLPSTRIPTLPIGGYLESSTTFCMYIDEIYWFSSLFYVTESNVLPKA